jgi:hypothetical protein
MTSEKKEAAPENKAAARAVRMISEQRTASMMSESQRRSLGALNAQHLANIIEEEEQRARKTKTSKSFVAAELFLSLLRGRGLPIDTDTGIAHEDFEVTMPLAEVVVRSNARILNHLFEEGLELDDSMSFAGEWSYFWFELMVSRLYVLSVQANRPCTQQHSRMLQTS